MDLFIATPSYDEWLCMEYVSSLFETGIRLTQAGIGLYHSIAPGNPFLDLARNALVEKFLATDATDLLFVDSDVGWDAKVITRVMSHKQEIVGGLVPKRDANNDALYHSNAMTGRIQDGLFECKELPTAFMRIKRSVFDKLKKPWFKIGSNEKDFGEDIYFCRRWMEAGGTMWIDSDINFTHRGSKAWRGNFFDHAVKSGLLLKEEAA
jgi:hypothetical protein